MVQDTAAASLFVWAPGVGTVRTSSSSTPVLLSLSGPTLSDPPSPSCAPRQAPFYERPRYRYHLFEPRGTQQGRRGAPLSERRPARVYLTLLSSSTPPIYFTIVVLYVGTTVLVPSSVHPIHDEANDERAERRQLSTMEQEGLLFFGTYFPPFIQCARPEKKSVRPPSPLFFHRPPMLELDWRRPEEMVRRHARLASVFQTSTCVSSLSTMWMWTFGKQYEFAPCNLHLTNLLTPNLKTSSA